MEPNKQKIKSSNIEFDSNKVRKGDFDQLIVKDINTGKDYGVVRNDDGSYDFWKGRPDRPKEEIAPASKYMNVSENYSRWINDNLFKTQPKGVNLRGILENYESSDAGAASAKLFNYPAIPKKTESDEKSARDVSKEMYWENYFSKNKNQEIPKQPEPVLPKPAVQDSVAKFKPTPVVPKQPDPVTVPSPTPSTTKTTEPVKTTNRNPFSTIDPPKQPDPVVTPKKETSKEEEPVTETKITPVVASPVSAPQIPIVQEQPIKPVEQEPVKQETVNDQVIPETTSDITLPKIEDVLEEIETTQFGKVNFKVSNKFNFADPTHRSKIARTFVEEVVTNFNHDLASEGLNDTFLKQINDLINKPEADLLIPARAGVYYSEALRNPEQAIKELRVIDELREINPELAEKLQQKFNTWQGIHGTKQKIEPAPQQVATPQPTIEEPVAQASVLENQAVQQPVEKINQEQPKPAIEEKPVTPEAKPTPDSYYENLVKLEKSVDDVWSEYEATIKNKKQGGNPELLNKHSEIKKARDKAQADLIKHYETVEQQSRTADLTVTDPTENITQSYQNWIQAKNKLNQLTFVNPSEKLKAKHEAELARIKYVRYAEHIEKLAKQDLPEKELKVYEPRLNAIKAATGSFRTTNAVIDNKNDLAAYIKSAKEAGYLGLGFVGMPEEITELNIEKELNNIRDFMLKSGKSEKVVDAYLMQIVQERIMIDYSNSGYINYINQSLNPINPNIYTDLINSINTNDNKAFQIAYRELIEIGKFLKDNPNVRLTPPGMKIKN
jgi:hypothetical protein